MIYIPFVLVAGLMLADLPSYRRRAGAERRDRGSYWVLSALLGGGYFLAFTLYGTCRVGGSCEVWVPLGAWAVWAGVAVCLLGITIRLWAILTLGGLFTRVVHVAKDQPVVERGPYRWIRHPSYTGGILSALGVALSMGALIYLVLIVVPMLVGMAYRIRVEEEALLETIGEPYRAYMGRTKRLIPGVL